MSIARSVGTEPAELRQEIAAYLADSDRLDHALRVSLGWSRWHARISFELGVREGRRREAAERDAAWAAIARPVSRIQPGDVDRKRWALRGEARTRATFSQPHPSDYPGQGGAA
jgi:hypothetical protein